MGVVDVSVADCGEPMDMFAIVFGVWGVQGTGGCCCEGGFSLTFTADVPTESGEKEKEEDEEEMAGSGTAEKVVPERTDDTPLLDETLAAKTSSCVSLVVQLVELLPPVLPISLLVIVVTLELVGMLVVLLVPTMTEVLESGSI